MARQEITRAVVGGNEYEVGQRVCVTGQGTAAIVHLHGTVERFTATMMIVKTDPHRIGADRYRYRTGVGFGTEVGAQPYGGSSVSPRCQRPKKREA